MLCTISKRSGEFPMPSSCQAPNHICHPMWISWKFCGLLEATDNLGLDIDVTINLRQQTTFHFLCIITLYVTLLYNFIHIGKVLLGVIRVSARGSSEEEIISFHLTSWIKVKCYEYVLTPSDHSLLLPDLHSQSQKHKQIKEQQKRSAILKYLRIKKRK